jgi:hypothetical protein
LTAHRAALALHKNPDLPHTPFSRRNPEKVGGTQKSIKKQAFSGRNLQKPGSHTVFLGGTFKNEVYTWKSKGIRGKKSKGIRGKK